MRATHSSMSTSRMSPRRRTALSGFVALSAVIVTSMPALSATTTPSPSAPVPGSIVDLPTTYQKPLTPPASASGPTPNPQLPADQQTWKSLVHVVHGMSGDTAQLYAAPAFRPGGAEGRWQSVDTSISAGNAPGVAAIAPDHVVALQLGTDLARVATLVAPPGAVTVGLSSLSTSSSAPTTDGVTYVAGSSVVVSSHVTRTGIRIDVVRTSPAAPNSVTLSIADPAQALGTAAALPDGSIGFSRVINGASVTIGAAMATISDGVASRDTAGVTTSLATTRNGETVQVGMPSAVGSTSAAPSTLSIELAFTSAQHGASGTATLAGDACATCALGAADVLTAASQPDAVDGARVQRGIVTFDTSTIPNGAVIDSATLTAHVNACIAAACSTGADVEVRPLSGPAGPQTTASGIASLTASSPAAVQHVAPTAQTASWDVSSLVQSWTNGTAHNFGLSLAAKNESSLAGGFAVAGPDTADGSTVPELDVAYHIATVDASTGTPAAPTDAGITVGTSSALVSWVAPATVAGDPIIGSQVALTDSDTGSSQTATASGTSAWFFGLVPGDHITASVYVETAGGRSASPATATSVLPTTTPTADVPPAPTGVAAAPGSSAVYATWAAPSSGSAAVSRYDVVAYDATGSPIASGVACGACTGFELRTGVAVVAAVGVTPSTNFGTIGAETRVSLATGTAAPASPAPSPSPTATPSPTPTPAGTTSTSTSISSPTSSSTSTTSVSSSSSSTATASPSTALPIGSSLATPRGTLLPETGGGSVPKAPTNVVGTPGNTTATITWTTPNGSSPTSYTVQAFTSGGTAVGSPVTVCGTCLSATVTGLTNGSTYYATVYGTNSNGNGPSTQSNLFTLSTGPNVQKFTRTTGSTYSRGMEISFGITISNPQNQAMTVSSATDTIDSGFVPELSVTMDSTDFVNGPFCTPTTTPSCTLNGNGTLTIGAFTLGANGSHTFYYNTIAVGSERGCAVDTTTASASNPYGSGSGSQSPVLCDAGLGTSPWFSTTPWPTGPQGSLSLNVGDGNAVATQDDSTAVPLHGDLTLGIHRAYNSLAQSSAAGPGMLGSAWWLTFDDSGAVAQGLTAAGLFLPPDESVAQPLAVTVVTADGGRTPFAFTSLSTPIDVTALGGGTGPLAVTIPRVLSLATPTYNRLCVDQVGGPPVGVHASMWRYVEVTSSNSTCTRSTWSASAVLGYGVERTDRIRYEFASDGHKLDTEDANGNEIRIGYSSQPVAGQALGNPMSVTEPSTGRSLSLTYISGSPSNEIDITDAATRVTKYFTNSTTSDATYGYLTSVTNPDGTQLTYVYGGCTGAASTQLCSASSPMGSGVTTRLTYAQSSSDGTTWIGPAHVAGVTDRRSTTTTVSVTAATDTTQLSVSGQNRLYSSFGPFDNAGEIDVVDPGTSRTITQSYLFWDSSAGTTCRQPDSVADHNLCSLVTQNLAGHSDTRYTKFLYGAEGQLLRMENCVSMLDSTRGSVGACSGEALDATTGTHAIYADAASGTAATFDDVPAGGGAVTSPSGVGPGGARWLATTLYALVDKTQSLPPRGNVTGLSSAQWQAYLTTITVDNVATSAPDQHGISNACSSTGSATGNTGRVCQTQGPVYDGTNHAITRFVYLPTGEVSSKASPLAVARNGTSPATTTYTYYADTDKDLSATTSAGGWLKAVTDPSDGTGTGGFAVDAYDAAGNVVRSWDRDATAGTLISSYPGTLASPPTATYTETIRSSYSAPGRYVTSSRDQLGNVATYTLDGDGNEKAIRPPRGTQAGNATYDITQAFDANDEMVCTIQPVEANGTLCNASGTRIGGATQTVYDVRGNAAQVTDPVGNVTVATFDAANRQVETTWIRGPQYNSTSSPYHNASMPAPPPANCPVLSTADGPFPAGSIECHAFKTYDGVGNITATTDGDGGQASTVYDAMGRAVSRSDERDSSGTWERTDTVYDEDGDVVRTCPPNSFNLGGTTTCASSSGVYDTVHTYDVNDRLATTVTCRGSCTSPTIYTTSYTYDADGNQITTTDPRTVTTTVAYNLLDRKTSSSYTRSGAAITTSWTYSVAGDVLDVFDPDVTYPSTHITATSYDADHRKVDVVQGSDNANAAAAGVLATNGGQNARTRTVYDADSHVVATLMPQAFLNSVSSPDTRFQARQDYDADGRVIAAWTPYSDSASGGPSDPSPSGQCPSGLNSAYPSTVGACVTKTAYDADGRAIATLLPTAAGNWTSPRQVSTAYTADGLKASTTAPSPTGSGTATSYAFYDASARTVKTLDAIGTPDVTVYSPDGLVTQHSAEPEVSNGIVAVWHCQTYAYDGNGNELFDNKFLDLNTPSSGCQNTELTEALTYTTDNFEATDTDSANETTTWTRDQVGNVTQVLSPAGSVRDASNSSGTPTTNTYTEDNLLLSSTVPFLPDGSQRRKTGYTYTPFGSKLSQTTNLVDVNGNVISGGGTQSYSYYPDERLQVTTGRNNETITDQYDGAGQPTSIAYAGGANPNTVTASYYLDEAPRQVNEGIPGMSGAGYTYSYDGAGATTYRSTAGYAGHTQTYARGDAGQVTSSADTNMGTWTWGYDGDGRLTQQNNPNSTSFAVGWNTDGTPLSVSPIDTNRTDLSQNCSWQYDSLYRLTSTYCTALEPYTGNTYNLNESFGYDGASHVTSYTHALNSQDIGQSILTFTGTYDHDGNRLSWGSTASAADTKRTDSYNADDSIHGETIGISQSHPSGTESTTYAYNPAGTVANDGCNSMGYDGFDQVTSANYDAGNQCGANTGQTFYYDGLHRQIGHTDGPYSNFTAVYHDGLTSNLSMVQRQWLPNVANREDYYAIAGDGTALADDFGAASGGFGKTEFFVYDQHRNPIRITDGYGNVVAIPLADPFGNPVHDVASGTTPQQRSSSNSTVGFKGFQANPTDQTQELGTRNYNPATGTFRQRDGFVDDPSGVSDAALATGEDPSLRSTWNYAGNDPVNLVDATGHDICRENPQDCMNDDGTAPDEGLMNAQTVGARGGNAQQVEQARRNGNAHMAAAVTARKAIHAIAHQSQVNERKLTSLNAETGAGDYVSAGCGAHFSFGTSTGKLLNNYGYDGCDRNPGGVCHTPGGFGVLDCRYRQAFPGDVAPTGVIFTNELTNYSVCDFNCISWLLVAIPSMGEEEAAGMLAKGGGAALDLAKNVSSSLIEKIFGFFGHDDAAAIPAHASSVLRHVDQAGGAPAGYKGGGAFVNDGRNGGQVLPRFDSSGNPINYREWDVNPFQPGVNRGAERLVTGNDGSAWYTDTHYTTFIRMR